MLNIRGAEQGSDAGGILGLTFVPVTTAMRTAFGRSREDLACALGMALPEGWPEFPEAFGSNVPQVDVPWTGYLFLVDDRIVGNGGFVGSPDGEGAVEIGYEIAPGYRNRGYATAAVRRMINLAFRGGATRVIAHSLAVPNASNAVMVKAGMRHVATCPDPDVGTTWRYMIENGAAI